MNVYHGSYLEVKEPRIIEDYIAGNITREMFWSLAKFRYPTHQIAFCTKESLRCLDFKKSEVV